MKTVKTAKGRTLDMAALAAKHEKTRAVSNMNLNARGDIIDNRNQVTIPREKIAKEFYKDNVPGADSKNISIKEDEKQHVNIDLVNHESKPLVLISVAPSKRIIFVKGPDKTGLQLNIREGTVAQNVKFNEIENYFTFERISN